MRTRILVGIALLAVVFAACGKDDKTNTNASKPKTQTAAKLAVASREIAPFGKVLTDADGRTLYFFDKDDATKPASACAGGCLTNWPPLLTSDGNGVGTGLDAKLLAHNTADQYTYNGRPLYRFSGDSAPGDTSGQGVGGVWHVAGADGNPSNPTATTTTAPSTATPAAKKTSQTAPPATSPPTTPATEAPHPATTQTTEYRYPY
jgi:predicted lipoprotein with Yx(FWY)xxD motif